jgi:hypothetical protein
MKMSEGQFKAICFLAKGIKEANELDYEGWKEVEEFLSQFKEITYAYNPLIILDFLSWELNDDSQYNEIIGWKTNPRSDFSMSYSLVSFKIINNENG